MDMKPYFDFLKEKLEECKIENPGNIGQACNDGLSTMYHYGCIALMKVQEELRKEEVKSA